MRWKVIASFFLILSLFMHVAIIFASTTNGLFQIDNYYKAALPGESVHFDMNLVNNEVNRETFLIHHAWENSVLYLPMDEGSGSAVADSSGNGNIGVLMGGTWVGGKYGEALSFDGVDDYVQVTHSSSLMSTYVSVSAWMKPVEILPSAKGIVRNGAGWGVEGYALLYVDGEVRFGIADAGGEDWIAASSSLVDLDVFSHVVGVYDGTKIYVYVNGVLANSKTTSITIGSNICDLYIGQIDGVGSSFFHGVIDDVRVYNRALNAEEIGWLYNNSWSESLSRYTVELEPGESTQVTFRVKVPEDARVGHVQKFLLTAFPLSNPEHVENQTVTVEVLPKYGVEVSLDENEKKGKPGEILNFQAAIRNLGNIEDTYDIQAEGGEEWNLSLPAESITVPAEEVGSFNISVTVPLNALLGNFTSFRIQAASRGNQSLTTNVNGTAIATATYRFNITSDPELRQASPGSEAIFSLEIENLGTAPDTIGLEIENLIGWDIKVDPSSISLEIGETGKATVRVRVPRNALIGQTNTITIRAVSSGDPTVSANSSISIEIVTPFWDIPDVRFLVGLFIGFLVGATLISTIILRRAQINRKENRRS